MMGIAASTATTAASVAQTGYNNYDGCGAILGTFFGVRSNTVGQRFSRRFSAIDYKVQRQQLHREDIRDLIELTTARVEIYHIVGTLLLTFGMGWFTDTALTTSELPSWMIDLFLINNFSSIGFLLICVLFGMYAAIAAKSIGTRLLTSYARLSYPNNQQIEDIKVPIFFNVREFIRKHCDRIDAEAGSWSTLGSRHLGELQARKREVISSDDEQHFRRFLEELPRWLLYDIWSRACLTFGLNTMLQALSYFTLGILWARSPLSAILSFFAIRVLSLVILFMDIGDGLLIDRWQVGVVVLRAILSPMVSVSLLTYQTFSSSNGFYDSLCMLVVIFIFASQAFYTYYLVFESKVAPMPMGRRQRRKWQEGELPYEEKSTVLDNYQFAPTQFAHVLEWVRPKSSEGPTGSNGTGVIGRESCESSEGLFSLFTRRLSQWSPNDGSERLSTRTKNETEAHQKSKRYIVNGGKAPGTWQTDTLDEADPFQADLAESPHTDWLPFIVVRRFTYTVILWWLMASFVHAFLIKSLTGFSFTGSDQIAFPYLRDSHSSEEPAIEYSGSINWPEPARLFKVEALHCSGARIFVTNKFSVYAWSQKSPADPATLERVKDGDVGAILCDTNGCDTLTPPSSGVASEPWVMSRLQVERTDNKISSSVWNYLARMVVTVPGLDQARIVALPKSWRLLSGVWTKCPSVRTDASCSSAMLAGWDGKYVFVGTLQKDFASKSWTLQTNVEVDPALGLCANQDTDSAHCPEQQRRGPRSYTDVKALQLSANGQMLIVLLCGGVIDIWNLSQGLVVERLHLHKNYTSMCQSEGNILLSRQADSGPVLAVLSRPQRVSRTLDQKTLDAKPGIIMNCTHMGRNHAAPSDLLQGWRGIHGAAAAALISLQPHCEKY